MAMINNLYPPIVSDTMPAFIRTEPCQIYFSLPVFNSSDSIKNVQISLINQKTNQSAFDNKLYPSGIKISKLGGPDPKVRDDYNYYVEIFPDDLIKSSSEETPAFGLNQFYKVQLRFTSKDADDAPTDGQQLASWIYNNTQYFSEWSKVCLIKGIEQPVISIHGFDDVEGEKQEVVLTSALADITGRLSYQKNALLEKEYLKSFNIKIYNSNDLDNPLMVGEEVYTNPYNPNEFNYQLTYDLLDGVDYTMDFTYTTNNLFTKTVHYNFTVIQRGIDKLNANITANADEENGRIQIDIIGKDTQPFVGNLTIRRTSSESNFHRWEDINTITYKTGENLNYTWYDTTIESGIWYKYCAQRRNAHGDRGAIIQIENPVMCILDDIFLTRNNCQLRLKFNPSLNEIKYNVSESQQNTIGAKYPFIKRNGANFYRSFPISGLISSFMDTTDWYDPHYIDPEDRLYQTQYFDNTKNEIKTFSSKSEIYGDSEQLYNEYNNKNNITEYNDYIYEREFRKKVYDFLYEHNVKLFRSTTQGNILIKLMNIDFQPIETLGRRLYNFSATAIEVDEANITNYNKYGIQTVGNYEKYVNYTHEIFGQISGTFKPSDGNLLVSKINPKYEKTANEGFINSVNSLKWLRLEIESDPYVIVDNGGTLVKADNNTNITDSNATVGHIAIINNKEVIIKTQINRYSPNPGNESNNKKNKPERNITSVSIFELKEENTVITDLEFKYETIATIDYTANLVETEDTSSLANRIYYYKKIGQLYDSFEPQDSLIQKIYNKYIINYKKYYQYLLDVTDINIESCPNAVLYVKDSKDNDFNRHVIENGYLQLKDNEATIEGLYFCGVHLTECTDPLEINTVNGLTDFVLKEGIYDEFSDILNPENGGIYQIRTYGLKSGTFLNTEKVIVINQDYTEHIEITPNNLYTLILDEIEDDDTLKFVYYYGCWYLLKDAYEKITLLKGDIRQIRDNEYILLDERYDSFDEIQNPVSNGVYWISSYVLDDQNTFETSRGVLTVKNNSVIINADQNYALLLKRIYEASKNRYIYYHGSWYLFTENQDVLCPVDGIVNYCCEIVKGVY